MSKAEEYAQWIVDNADKKGTPEFDTVAQAYQAAKSQTTQPESKTDKFLKPLQSMSMEDWSKNSIIAPVANYLFQKSPMGKLLPSTLASVAPVSPEQRQQLQGLDRPATAGNVIDYMANGSPLQQGLQDEARQTVVDKGSNIVSAALSPIETGKAIVNAVSENPYGVAGEMVKGALYDPQFLPNSVLNAAVKPITAPINIAKDIKAARDVTKYGIGESAFAPVSREVVEAASNPNLWPEGKAPLSQRDAAKILPHNAQSGQVLREGKTVQGMAENWFNQPGWQKALTPAIEAGMLGLSAMGVPYVPGLGGYTAGALKAGEMATDLPKSHPFYGQQTFTYNEPMSTRLGIGAKKAAKDATGVAASATTTAAARDFDEDRQRRKEAYDVARRILSRGM
jgi:hypothetical protein